MRTIVLIPLTASVVRRRLTDDTFEARLDGMAQAVAFGPEWPGDLLGVFQTFAAADCVDEAIRGQFAVVGVDRAVAVGAIGLVGPIEHGEAEIGYGINAAEQGHGYATSAVALLAEALWHNIFTADYVGVIIAKTAVANRGSERVLEKNGFTRTGADYNEEDGDLVTWRLARPGEVVSAGS